MINYFIGWMDSVISPNTYFSECSSLYSFPFGAGMMTHTALHILHSHFRLSLAILAPRMSRRKTLGIWVITTFAGFGFLQIVFTLPETYEPVGKAKRLRKETGDQNHYAPLPGEGGLR
jgi:hypothetical protein